jgi:hypothetical protein
MLPSWMSGFDVVIRYSSRMTTSEWDILQMLMRARNRIAAAAWLVVRDAHAAEDIFENVALKAMRRKSASSPRGQCCRGRSSPLVGAGSTGCGGIDVSRPVLTRRAVSCCSGSGCRSQPIVATLACMPCDHAC